MQPTANYFILSFFCSLAIMLGCSNSDVTENNSAIPNDLGGAAAVTGVTVSGTPGNYTFSVTVSSPDTGCAQYADWWEVLDTNGSLIYRRILAHSHVNEQPFTRSGGSVAIDQDTEVYVRAHMNTAGYGSTVFSGSVGSGFKAEELASDFAMELASQQPLPSGCAF